MSARVALPQCGLCGSINVTVSAVQATRYGVCLDCKTLQEVETRPDPCSQLCDNCAFRPNSPERAEPYTWMRMYELHVETGVSFYCHKGLPLALDLETNRTKVIGGAETERIAEQKPCAGWLANRRAFLAKQSETPA